MKPDKKTIEKAQKIMQQSDKLMRLEGQEVTDKKSREWLLQRLISKLQETK